MICRLILVTGATLAVSAAAPSRAATLTTDFATWAAHAPGAEVGAGGALPLYSITSTVPIAGSNALATDTPVTVLQPLFGWGPWSGDYNGAIYDTAGRSITLTPARPLTALALELAPDAAGVLPPADTFTVTLSDGTSRSIADSFAPGVTQFIGFYGPGVTSLTISVANAPDFAFGDIAAVPEPASLALLGTGLVALAWRRNRCAR